MPTRPENREPRNAADRAARSTIGGESTAFGFSIMITATFGAVQWQHGSPVPGDLLLYGLGAVAGFTALEAAASRGARESLPEHSSNMKTLGTLMNFASVLLAIGAAIGVSALIKTDAAWPLCRRWPRPST